MANKLFTKDIANQLAEDFEISGKKAKYILEIVFGRITQNLSNGEIQQIRNFGTFSPVLRKARKIKDFRTKQIIEIPASISVSFNPSKKLNENMK